VGVNAFNNGSTTSKAMATATSRIVSLRDKILGI
jgi:hypothetical protein